MPCMLDRPRDDRQIPADLRFDRQPEGVINTQRMMCANQAMIRGGSRSSGRASGPARLAALKSHLWQKSQFRADALLWRLDVYRLGQADARRHRGDGAQSPEIAPTVYFNVPKGYESLLPYLRATSFARRSFSPAQAMFFSGAGAVALRRTVFEALAVQEHGFRVPMLTSLGATETAPRFM